MYLKNFCAAHLQLLLLLWQKENIEVEEKKEKKQCPIFLYTVPGHADAM